MMRDIRLPQLGESIMEATITRWLKQAGDPVRPYEPLFEVETDKVSTEITAEAAGTLAEICIAAGETVPVGTLLARLAPAEAPVAPAEAPAAPAEAPAARPPKRREGPPISPVVARMSAEHGIDVSALRGSGAGGRVTKQDMLRHLAAHQTAPAPAPPTPVAPLPPLPPAELPADSELVPLTPMRRAIAEHMTRSVRTAPHVTSVFEVDMGAVVAHRQQQQPAFAQQGVRLTYTAYLLHAAAAALQAVPVVNARYSDEGIIYQRRVHIGLAVALDAGQGGAQDGGLLVPVVRDANEKSLLGLARTAGDLTARARASRLQPGETHGGTFTLTNHGTGGSLLGTPIIHQPQAAILGVGALVKRPVVLTAAGQDSIAIRPRCYVALTFDHRLIDGATADRFLAHLCATLEGWRQERLR